MGTPWWQHLSTTVWTMAPRHVWQPWVPHVGRMSLLELHGLTGAGVFVAAGATDCGILQGVGPPLPAGFIIWAISGWLCFSSRILVHFAEWKLQGRPLVPSLQPVAYQGQWQWAFRRRLSGSGLVGRLASVQGSPLPCFHTGCVPIPRALWARVPVCGGALWAAGVPNARMKGLSGSVGDGRFVIAATARKMSPSLISYEGGDFFPMAGSESAHGCCSVYPVFGSIYFLFHTACETIGVRHGLFQLNLFSCHILWACHPVLAGSQIDEYNIVWRHRRCAVAILLACGSLQGVPSPFCSMIVPSIGTSIVAFRLTCAFALPCIWCE